MQPIVIVFDGDNWTFAMKLYFASPCAAQLLQDVLYNKLYSMGAIFWICQITQIQSMPNGLYTQDRRFHSVSLGLNSKTVLDRRARVSKGNSP
jgi:hypothetical protein